MLLEDPEIVTQIKVKNTRLISQQAVLSSLSNNYVEQLLKYAIQMPPQDASQQIGYKYPFVAAQILSEANQDLLRDFTVDNKENDEESFNPMDEEIVEKEKKDLIGFLFGFVRYDKVNDVLAGYFSKILQNLIFHNETGVMDYLSKNMSIWDDLVKHLENTSITEVINKIVSDKTVINKILTTLNNNIETHQNAIQILQDHIELVSYENLMDIAINSNDQSVLRSVFLLLSKMCKKQQELDDSTDSVDYKIVPQDNRQLLILPKAMEILRSESKDIELQHGKQQVCGMLRLSIIEWLMNIYELNKYSVIPSLIENKVIQCLIDMTLKFEQNNFLLNQVDTFISLMIEQNNESLIKHILHDTQLLNIIIEVNECMNFIYSRQRVTSRCSLPLFRKFANLLIKMQNHNLEIKLTFESMPEWSSFVENTLQEINDIEDNPLVNPQGQEDLEEDFDKYLFSENNFNIFSKDFMQKGSKKRVQYCMQEEEEDEECWEEEDDLMRLEELTGVVKEDSSFYDETYWESNLTYSLEELMGSYI